MTPDLLSSLNKNGTGLQLRELAQTLATAETVPRIERLQRAQDADTLRLSGLGQVRAQLDQLGTRLAEAAGNPVLTVESSTAMLAPRVTDRAALTNGSMFVDVTNLAQPQVLEFSGFTGADQPLAAGSLTLEFGAWSEDAFNANPDREAITIDVAEGATLQDMVRQLDALPGVSAQLFDKGDGTFSLGVASDTGAENALRITAQDLGGPGQALTAFDNASDNQARQVQAARDAQLTVNGISVTRPSNTIADVVPGVELTLNGATSGVLDIGRSETAARQNLQSLVDGLNDTFGLLREVTRNGIGDEARGDLAGDGNLQALDSALRRLVSEPIAGFDDEPVTLAELGVATNRDGSLRLDPPAFDRAFAARAADFDVLFQNKLRALSGQAEVSGNPQAALPAGDYRFAVDGQGRATLDGARMSGFERVDGQMVYTVLDGPARGVSVTAPPDLTSDTIRFGRSFAESLATLMDNAVAESGLIGRREAELDSNVDDRAERIDLFEARATLLEKRYMSRFAAMEQAVSQMNSTGSYLQNLVEMWSNQK